MADLKMPSLGADMTSGKLLEWHVAPGDAVKRGDIVATVDTDKAEIDIETFDAGVVGALLIEPGTSVDVGTPIARIDANGAQPAPPPAAVAPPPAAVAPPPAATTPAPAPPAAHVHHRRVSPLARRIAAELGVDVDALTGTGPQGAVTRVDVERAGLGGQSPESTGGLGGQTPESTGGLGGQTPESGVEHRAPAERLESLRAIVGELMARSKREIPHFHLQREIDLTAALTWLEARNHQLPPAERILPAALLLRAVALAAHDEPTVNGTYADRAFQPAGQVDLGVAVSLRAGGVIAPVIPAADQLELAELMDALRGLTDRVRHGALRGSDFTAGTLTVTSLGEHGADLVHGVIFPPQVALVGFGVIAERPWAAGGMLGVRRTVVATLAADHRVSEGHHGSLFLAALDHHLQEPDQL